LGFLSRGGEYKLKFRDGPGAVVRIKARNIVPYTAHEEGGEDASKEEPIEDSREQYEEEYCLS